MNIVLSPNTNMKKYFCILCVLSLLYLTACDKKDVTTPAPMLDPILQEEHEKIDDHPKIWENISDEAIGEQEDDTGVWSGDSDHLIDLSDTESLPWWGGGTLIEIDTPDAIEINVTDETTQQTQEEIDALIAELLSELSSGIE